VLCFDKYEISLARRRGRRLVGGVCPEQMFFRYQGCCHLWEPSGGPAQLDLRATNVIIGLKFIIRRDGPALRPLKSGLYLCKVGLEFLSRFVDGGKESLICCCCTQWNSCCQKRIYLKHKKYQKFTAMVSQCTTSGAIRRRKTSDVRTTCLIFRLYTRGSRMINMPVICDVNAATNPHIVEAFSVV